MQFKQEKIMLTSKKIKLSLLIIACVAAFYAIYAYMTQKLTYHEPATHVASIIRNTKPLTTFALTDTNNTPFTEHSLRGHWTLLFFGYTRCPDICPRTLAIVRDTWSQFNKYAPARFVFADISKDPASLRDLKQFVANYNQDFIGISGTPLEMHQLSDQLGIYAQEVLGQDAVTARIDHTAALMLIDPQARLRAVLTPPFNAADIKEDLEAIINL